MCSYWMPIASQNRAVRVDETHWVTGLIYASSDGKNPASSSMLSKPSETIDFPAWDWSPATSNFMRLDHTVRGTEYRTGLLYEGVKKNGGRKKLYVLGTKYWEPYVVHLRTVVLFLMRMKKWEKGETANEFWGTKFCRVTCATYARKGTHSRTPRHSSTMEPKGMLPSDPSCCAFTIHLLNVSSRRWTRCVQLNAL